MSSNMSSTPFTALPAAPQPPASLRWWLLAGIALACAAPWVVYPMFLIKLMCLALLAASVNFLIGYAGLLSFGHAMFYGSAAYVTGFVAKDWGQDGVLAILAGVGVALSADETNTVVAQFFYVWISVLNLFIVSVFWSFLLELFDANAEIADHVFADALLALDLGDDLGRRHAHAVTPFSPRRRSRSRPSGKHAGHGLTHRRHPVRPGGNPLPFRAGGRAGPVRAWFG